MAARTEQDITKKNYRTEHSWRWSQHWGWWWRQCSVDEGVEDGDVNLLDGEARVDLNNISTTMANNNHDDGSVVNDESHQA